MGRRTWKDWLWLWKCRCLNDDVKGVDEPSAGKEDFEELCKGMHDAEADAGVAVMAVSTVAVVGVLALLSWDTAAECGAVRLGVSDVADESGDSIGGAMSEN